MEFPTDIRVLEAAPILRHERARIPLKFGGVVTEEGVFLICRVCVENRRGDTAEGYGGIFLSDVWAWPTPRVDHPIREEAMRRVSEAYIRRIAEYKRFTHPIEIFLETEHELHQIARYVSEQMGTEEEIPFLAALVSASPVDAALHDAFGNVNGFDSYQGYGRECAFAATRYLSMAKVSPGFNFAGAQGRYVGDFLRDKYLPEVPMFHLVGGLDKLTRSELTDDDPRDGLPVSLDDWIKVDGLFCLKIKLRGVDLEWDLQRMIDVHRIAVENCTLDRPLALTADTNEMCDSPEYMVELLTRLREQSLPAFDALLYVEQPTHRDLKRYPFRMDSVAALKPVFVDESLTDMESYELARELGASGVALKTCKCQSSCLVMVARCHLDNFPYAVQDLTNPSLALLQSVGLAARIHTVMGVEANSRQFFPEASRDIAKVHEGIVSRKGGVARTSSLSGTGLGYQVEHTGLLNN